MITLVTTEGFDAENEILQLHEQVDQIAAPIAQDYPGKMQCSAGCSGCCVDELTVFEVEANVLKARYQDLFRRESPHPPGQCALLDAEGLCRVYHHRPYVCRTQGLPLRWIEDDFEHRTICELNEENVSLINLPSKQCFELGPNESQLAMIQARYQGARPGTEALRRVALRALFEDEGKGSCGP